MRGKTYFTMNSFFWLADVSEKNLVFVKNYLLTIFCKIIKCHEIGVV